VKNKLTHLTEEGHAHMVDVGAKPETAREAIASGRVAMDMETAKLIDTGQIGKGDVLAVARLAGIRPRSAPRSGSRCAIRCGSRRSRSIFTSTAPPC